MAFFSRKMVLVILGASIGILSHYVVTGWYTIIPWVLITPALGLGYRVARQAVIGGLLFGYVLFFTYLIMGYGGRTDFSNLVKFTGFSMLFSLVGALCGLAGTYIGYSIGVLVRGGREDREQEAP